MSKNIIQKFISGGALGIVRMCAGLIRVKYLTLMVGVAGIGIISQANTFYIFSVAMMTLSMAGGIINRIRDPKRINNSEAKAITQGTAFFTILILIMIYYIFFYFFADDILKKTFQGYLSMAYLLPALIGLPFHALASGYFEAVFISRDRYNLYVKGSILALILELFSYLIFIYFFALKGAFIALGLSGPIVFCSFMYYLRKLNEPLSSIISIRFDIAELFKVLKFCFAILSSSALGYFVYLWVRADIIKTYGIIENGLLQPAVAISAYSLPLVTNGIWGHLHPAASSKGDTRDGRVELNKVLHIVLIISGILSLSFITFSEQVIWLAFSGDFIPGEKLFPYQLTGDFFYFIFFSVNAYFFSTSKIRYYFASWFAYFLGFFILVKLLVSDYGILAYSVSHLLASISLFLVCTIWMIKNQILSKNIVILFAASLLILISASGAAAYELSLIVRVPIWLIGMIFFYKAFTDRSKIADSQRT